MSGLERKETVHLGNGYKLVGDDDYDEMSTRTNQDTITKLDWKYFVYELHDILQTIEWKEETLNEIKQDPAAKGKYRDDIIEYSTKELNGAKAILELFKNDDRFEKALERVEEIDAAYNYDEFAWDNFMGFWDRHEDYSDWE